VQLHASNHGTMHASQWGVWTLSCVALFRSGSFIMLVDRLKSLVSCSYYSFVFTPKSVCIYKVRQNGGAENTRPENDGSNCNETARHEFARHKIVGPPYSMKI